MGRAFVQSTNSPMVALNLPTFACACCKQQFPSEEFLNRKTGEYRQVCRKCAVKESTHKSKQRPAYKAMAREQQRDLMRRKRYEVADVLRATHYYGLAVLAPLQAYIPTPVEELEAKEEWEQEMREGNLPRSNETTWHPTETRAVRMIHKLAPYSS
jgi:hypothetical protein